MIGINNWLNFFDVSNKIISVAPGEHTKIEVDARQHGTTESFDVLKLSERKCRMIQEQNDTKSLFKVYTRKLCRYRIDRKEGILMNTLR